MGAFRLARRSAALIVASLMALACAVPIARDLEEAAANEAIVALEEGGIHAAKEPDPESEGRWQVSVAREEASHAVAVLTERSLPPREAPGVLDALGKGSIVPSRTAEHAKLIAGTAGELERSLRAIQGVLGARVHLAVPDRDPLAAGDTVTAPSASVLVRHRGATSPIAVGDVQRLVAGAIPGLAPERVSVVTLPVAVSSQAKSAGLTTFGPITVTRSSLLSLRVAVGVVVLLNALLIGLLLALWARFRRAQAVLALRGADETAQRSS